MTTKVRPPTLANPRFVKTLHSLDSFSFGSGLCNQSSFSTSSGNRRRPADGRMLYFSDTVWVLTFSSSLPALDGVLESAKGSNPYILLSRPFPSELKLVLLEKPSTGDPGTDSSSRNRCVLDRVGGMSKVSDESIGPPLYTLFRGLFPRSDAAVVDGAGVDFCCGTSDRDERWRLGANGSLLLASFVRRLLLELLRRTWTGGVGPRAPGGDVSLLDMTKLEDGGSRRELE